MRVGSISKIELTPDFTAKVTMSLEDVHLKSDVVAVLRQTSLLVRSSSSFDRATHRAPTTTRAAIRTRNRSSTTPTSRSRTPVEAPELEFVADPQYSSSPRPALPNDFATIVQTGSVGFAGRGEELHTLIGDLSTISATLADQTTNIQTIIDGTRQGDVDARRE